MIFEICLQYLNVWYVISEIPDIIEKGDTCQRTENLLFKNGTMQINETSTKWYATYPREEMRNLIAILPL